ncbi:MAG: metallophosphoesterase [Sphingomonadaceae bacterium]
MKRRLIRWLSLALCTAAVIVAIFGFISARAPITVAHYRVHAPGLRCTSPPFRVVVIGDLHVSDWTTPPTKVAEAVARANAERPDLVLLVGDYFGQGWPEDRAARAAGLAPLPALRPRIATVAILGNNDWIDGAPQITGILSRMGVVVLDNDALVTPEVSVMGVADISSDTANPLRAIERAAAKRAAMHLPPAPLSLWLAHDAMMFDRVETTGNMLFTGHTHGGQVLPDITIPLIRPMVQAARAFGFKASWPAEKYVRGHYHESGKRMIETSGIGTSGLPQRLGVPPEILTASFTGCGTP